MTLSTASTATRESRNTPWRLIRRRKRPGRTSLCFATRMANAVAALEVGATHIQGTINGYGERTGNCNLTSVIPTVALKLKKSCVPESSLALLKELSQFVDEIANLRHNPRQPWV